MSASRRPQSRPLELLRAAWGMWLLAAPREVLHLLGGIAEPDNRSLAVTRVLGARQLAQAMLSGLRPSPAVLAAGAWVDGVHALTAATLSVFDPKRMRTAGPDACVAAVWSQLGRRDVTRPPMEAVERGWSDRVARAVLPLLPGAPTGRAQHRSQYLNRRHTTGGSTRG